MRVNIETKNKETVAFVEGSINSANSKEFADALAAFPGEAESITLDIPTANSYDVVDVDGRIGVVYELIKSKTIGELIRAEITKDNANIDEYVKMYADICKKVHSIHTSDPEIASFKEANRADIANVKGVTDEERQYLHRFLDLVPEADTCIHGDLNINNIMVQCDECCLIDMRELSTGTPMFDISRILFSMIYAAPVNDEYYAFYKMPTATVKEIYEKFFRCYFGCSTIEEAGKTYPEVKWLHPLAWFRCCTSMLKSNRWGEEMRNRAICLLCERLIPFVDKEEAFCA